MPQLNLFQHGEDLPLFSRPPFEPIDLGPVAPEGWTPLDPCPACGCEDIRIGHGGPGYPATYATCQRCGWQDILQEPPDEPEMFASGFCVDDLDEGPAYPLGQCAVCHYGIWRADLTLCRRCADEQIAELDESYKARGISWEVYTQGVNICLERSGRLPQ